MNILVDKERMNSIIEFWQKKCADAEKELECSINLRKQIQNDLLKSDRLNDNLEAENEKLKALCDTYKTCYQAKHNDIDGKLFKYRQTLQEIRAIAESAMAKQQEYKKDFEQILDLITESEEE